MKANTLLAGAGRGFLLLLAAAHVATSASGEAASTRVVWSKPVEVASGAAYRGPWRMNESDFRYVDDPTVAISRDGVAAVAWADQARKDIFFQIYEPDATGRFAEPVNVSKSPGIFSWLPRMVIRSGDPIQVYILWQEIVFSGGSHGGEIFFARSADGGRTFSDPINLSNSPAGDGKGRLTKNLWHNGSLDLAMGAEGNLYAAWTEYEGTLWFSRSTDGGNRFSAPKRVAGGGAAAPARGPSLAVDARDAVYLAWSVGEDPAAGIRFARSADRGLSFGKPEILFRGGGHSDAPKIAVDRKGIVHLVYAESAAGSFQRYRIRYARSHDAGRTFVAPQEISGRHAQQFESLSFPALGLDGADNLYVVWEQFPNRQRYPRGLGFTFSGDGGRRFAPPAVVPGSANSPADFNGSTQGLLMRKLAVNETGAIAIVNSTFRVDATSRVWLLRGQADGR